MTSIVSLQECKLYNNRILKDKIVSGLEQTGFDFSGLKGARVCLKPNLLMPFPPERAVTTHPEFFRAVAEIMYDYTKDLVLIESPNFFPLEPTMRKAGLSPIVKELNIEVADIQVTRTLHSPQARHYKSLEISRAYFDVDYIINLPKLKTHAFTHYTGAVKNLFGTMPGLRKSRMHMRAPSQMEFSNFLLDLYSGLLAGFEKPKKMLHIMDAVVGMEGEGPGPSGKPRAIGAILVGNDAVALDFVAVNLVGLDVKKVFIIQEGIKRAIGVRSPADIIVVGESLEKMRLTDFVPARNTIMGGVFWPVTSPTVKNLFIEKPTIDPNLCKGCGHCSTVCPAQAILIDEDHKRPRFKYRACIRCFCCMETCPESAITLKKGALQWLMRI
jgi:uncharacterized protein (DUF362 family)/Pyruvate/2-oxoacid:ferredoxin oxidoreductase delta subunit